MDVVLINKSRIDHGILPQCGQGKRVNERLLSRLFLAVLLHPNGTAIK
jgi:hypothetical protein